MSNYKFLDLSDKSRVFAVGDIHGCYAELDILLDVNSFDTEKDFLISVGDLVDRGPASARCLEFIDQPWFQHVVGNHERMVRENIHSLEHMFVMNGGGWLNDYDRDDRIHFANKLNAGPLLLEIKTPGGSNVGFSHASVPFTNWQMNVEAADVIDYEHTFLWDRSTFQATMKHTAFNATVEGIDRVYHGHNALYMAYKRGNRCYIDTGASFEDGKLTIVNVDDFGDGDVLDHD